MVCLFVPLYVFVCHRNMLYITLQFGVSGYHLYLLHYTGRSSYNQSEERRLINAFLTERITHLAAQGCHVTFSDRNVRDISKRSHDAHDVNLVMMDAYLDDGVDFFMLVFPHKRQSTGRDLQHLPSRSFVSCVYCFFVHQRRRGLGK